MLLEREYAYPIRKMHTGISHIASTLPLYTPLICEIPECDTDARHRRYYPKSEKPPAVDIFILLQEVFYLTSVFAGSVHGVLVFLL